MLRTQAFDAMRGFLLGAGLLLGLALALVIAPADLSWETGAIGLSLGLAALVGLAQTCSA